MIGGLGIVVVVVGLGLVFKDDEKGDKDKEFKWRISLSEEDKMLKEVLFVDILRVFDFELRDCERKVSDEELCC